MAKVKLSKGEMKQFYGAASKDLMDFCIAMDRNYDPQWFHEEISKALMKIASREIKRLIIEMPPRHGKSEETTVNFPAFYLGLKPEDEVITASYSSDLASKFGARCRDIMSDPRYKLIFPGVELKQDTQAKDYWRTTKGGGYMSVGVGGAATGSGADVFLIDDPLKNREEADSLVMRDKIWEWYTNVARTRLEKDGAIIVIMTRWHPDDLVGRILDRETEGGEKWHRINFPAIAEKNDRFRDAGDPLWPAKYSKEDMEQIRRDVGERAWFALYQQQPIATETQIFKPEWMKREFTDEMLVGKTLNRYATIDTADTDKEGADYIGVTIADWDADNNWYFQKIRRYRLNILGLVDLVFNIWQGDKPLKIGIEKKSFLDQLKPLLDEKAEELGIFPVIEELKHGGRNKEARIIGALQGRFEKGKIWFKKGAKDDTEALKRELFDFPKGKNDDLCLVGDTKVQTLFGSRALKDIRVGDLVLTPIGFKRVLAVYDRGIKEVVSNIGLVGTHDHPVFKNRTGFMAMDSIGYNDVICMTLSTQIRWGYQKLLSLMDGHSGLWGKEGITYLNRVKIQEESVLKDCMLRSGNMLMGRQYKKAMQFITKTITSLTITLVIWSWLTVVNMVANTCGSGLLSLGHLKEQLRLWQKSDRLQRSGTPAKRGDFGIKSMVKMGGRTDRKLDVFVGAAERVFSHLLPAPSSVAMHVQPNNVGDQGSMMRSAAVASVVLSSHVTNTSIRRTAQESAALLPQPTRDVVYDITVEDAHCFYANGVLVGNCDSAAYISDIGARPFSPHKEVKSTIANEIEDEMRSRSRFKSLARRV